MPPGNFEYQWAMVTAPRLPTVYAPALASISRGSVDWVSRGWPALVLAPAGGQAANIPCQCRETWQLLARGGSTVGPPCSEVICGSLASFIEKHVLGRGWRLGRVLLYRRCTQKLDRVLLLPRSLQHLKRSTQMSWSRHSGGQGLCQGQPWQTIPVHISTSFQSCLGGFASLSLSFSTCSLL